MRKMMQFLAGLAALLLVPAVKAQEPVPPQLQAFLDNLHPKGGRIVIPEAKVTLDLGQDYLFYNAAEAKAILTDLWGNPPEASQDVLGLVMPAGTTPISDSWGAVVSFEKTGFVADDDAASADYGDLLKDLKQATEDANADRTADGYPAMHLVGWAEQPKYDAGTHSVVWAQNLKFDGQDENSLNYDLRSLGRYGVLSVNFLSTMPSLGGIRLAAQKFASHAQFDAGARYADFNEATDEKADFGVAGLVAAGVGVAAAKKLGLFAILLKFLKPLLVAIFVGFAAMRKRLAGWLGFGKSDPGTAEWDDGQDEWVTGTDQTDAAPAPETAPPAPQIRTFGRKPSSD